MKMNTAKQVSQKNFVSSLVDDITHDILDKIANGEIPPEWEERELRQFLADQFLSQVLPMTRKRKLAYRNIVNSLS